MKDIDYGLYRYKVTEEGAKIVPSLDLFYGPWDSKEYAEIEIKKSLQIDYLPNYITIGIVDKGQLTEYYYLDGVWYQKSNNNSNSSYIKQVFAYSIEKKPNKLINQTPIQIFNNSDDLKWSLTIPSSYEEGMELWVSHAYFISSDGVDNIISYSGLTIDDNEEHKVWSEPYLIGAVKEESFASRFVLDSDNDNILIPVDPNGYITNEALKNATYTTVRMWENGMQTNFNSIILKGLQNGSSLSEDFSPEYQNLIIKIVENNDSDPSISFYLEFKDSDGGHLNQKTGGLMFAASKYSSSVNSYFIWTYQLVYDEVVYKLITQPNIINLPSTGLLPTLVFGCYKFGFNGKTEYELDGDFYLKIYYDNNEIYNNKVNGNSLVLNLEDLHSSGKLDPLKIVSGSVLKVSLCENDIEKDYDYLPIFKHSDFVISTSFSADLTNNKAFVSEQLFGKTDYDSKNALRVATETTLQIKHNLSSISDYQITDIVCLQGNELIEYNFSDESKKAFYLSRVDVECSILVEFKYVYEGQEYTGTVGYQVVEVPGVETISLKAFPNVLWKKDGGFLDSSLSFTYQYVNGNTVRYLTSKDDILNGYSLTISSEDKSISVNDLFYLDCNDISWIYDSSRIKIQLKKNNSLYDEEEIDICDFPKNGIDGKSNYLLTIDNNSIILDDDSSVNENSTLTRCSLMYGGIIYTGKVEYSAEGVIYDSSTSNSVFENYFNINQDNLKTSNFYITLKQENSIENISLYGLITYTAKVNNEIVASISQPIKVLDYSDGVNYKLIVTPNVLYKNNVGAFLDQTNRTINIKAIKVSAEDPQSEIENAVILLKSPNGDTRNIGVGNYTFDINEQLQEYYTIELKLTDNGLTVDSETIYFSIQGEDGISVDSGYRISINNDNIIVDNNITNDDLKILSLTEAILTNDGEIVNEDIEAVISNDSELDIIKEGNQFYLKKKDGINLLTEAVYSIEYKCVKVLENVVATKKQNISIKDFSLGENYKLSVSPNYLRKDVDNNLLSGSLVSCFATKLYNGNVETLSLGKNPQMQISVYAVNDKNETVLKGTYPNDNNDMFNTNGDELIIDLSKLESFEYDCYVINMYKILNNGESYLVDSETVQFAIKGEKGVDGADIEYIYLRTTNESIPGLNIEEDEVSKDNYLPFDNDGNRWSDDQLGVNGEFPCEWMSKRKKNNNNWEEFSTPILISRYGGTQIHSLQEWYLASNKTSVEIPRYSNSSLIGWNKVFNNELSNLNASTKYLYNITTFLQDGDIVVSEPKLIYTYKSGDSVSLNHLYVSTKTNLIPNESANWQNTLPGVNDVLKYLWKNVVIKVNDVENNNISLLTYYGKSGKSPYIFTLDNDYVIINDDVTKETLNILLSTGYKLTCGSTELQVNDFECCGIDKVYPIEGTSSIGYAIVQKEFLLNGDLNNGDYYKITYRCKYNDEYFYASQTVKVVNVSEDGNSYKLILDRNVLYKDSSGNPLSEDNSINVSLLKITGENNFEYIDSSNQNFAVVAEVTNNGKTTVIGTESMSSYYVGVNNYFCKFDFSNYINSDNINIKVYYVTYESGVEGYSGSIYDETLIDQQSINFSIQGEPGAGGYTIDLENGVYIVDDQTSGDNFKNVTTESFKILKQTEGTFENIEYQIKSITIPSEIQSYVKSNIIEGKQSYLTRIGEGNLPYGSFLIKYELSFDGLSVNKYGTLKVSEISTTGQVYKLNVNPNIVQIIKNSNNQYVYDGGAWGKSIYITPVQYGAITGNLSLTGGFIVKVTETRPGVDNPYITIYSDDSSISGSKTTQNGVCEYQLLSLGQNSPDDFDRNPIQIELIKDDLTLDISTVTYAIEGKSGKDGINGENGQNGLDSYSFRYLYRSSGHPISGFNYFYDKKTNEKDILIRDVIIDDLDKNNISAWYCNIENGFITNNVSEDESVTKPDSNYFYRKSDNKALTNSDLIDISMDQILLKGTDVIPFVLVDGLEKDLFVENLLALNAKIDTLSTNEIILQKEESEDVYGKMSGKEDIYPLWIGGKNGTTAAFSVDKNGVVKCSNSKSVFGGFNIAERVKIELTDLPCKIIKGNAISDFADITESDETNIKVFYLDPTKYGSYLYVTHEYPGQDIDETGQNDPIYVGSTQGDGYSDIILLVDLPSYAITYNNYTDHSTLRSQIAFIKRGISSYKDNESLDQTTKDIEISNINKYMSYVDSLVNQTFRFYIKFQGLSYNVKVYMRGFLFSPNTNNGLFENYYKKENKGVISDSFETSLNLWTKFPNTGLSISSPLFDETDKKYYRFGTNASVSKEFDVILRAEYLDKYIDFNASNEPLLSTYFGVYYNIDSLNILDSLEQNQRKYIGYLDFEQENTSSPFPGWQ